MDPDGDVDDSDDCKHSLSLTAQDTEQFLTGCKTVAMSKVRLSYLSLSFNHHLYVMYAQTPWASESDRTLRSALMSSPSAPGVPMSPPPLIPRQPGLPTVLYSAYAQHPMRPYLTQPRSFLTGLLNDI
jgi:hypothetical protein